jgi:hypothetical protein
MEHQMLKQAFKQARRLQSILEVDSRFLLSANRL